MAKERSRAYPALDLAAAYGLLRQPLAGMGTEALDREELARRLGYHTGQGGVAARKIAALVHYGMLDRLPLGRYSLSRRGLFLQSLRPENPRLRVALQDSLEQPALFREILNRYRPVGRIASDLPRVLTEYGITAKASVDAAGVLLRSAHFAGVLQADGSFTSVTESAEDTLEGTPWQALSVSGVPSGVEAAPEVPNDRLELRLTHRKTAWLEIPPAMTPRDLEILEERLSFELDRLGEYLGIERSGEGKLLSGNFQRKGTRPTKP